MPSVPPVWIIFPPIWPLIAIMKIIDVWDDYTKRKRNEREEPLRHAAEEQSQALFDDEVRERQRLCEELGCPCSEADAALYLQSATLPGT